jgi:hypothetical protein
MRLWSFECVPEISLPPCTVHSAALLIVNVWSCCEVVPSSNLGSAPHGCPLYLSGWMNVFRENKREVKEMSYLYFPPILVGGRFLKIHYQTDVTATYKPSHCNPHHISPFRMSVSWSLTDSAVLIILTTFWDDNHSHRSLPSSRNVLYEWKLREWKNTIN